MRQEGLSDEVVATIRDFLEQEMVRFGLTRVDVVPGTDHDGDPAIRIDARYGEDGDPIDPNVMARLGTKLRTRLWERGEDRFPYVRHHFPEDRKVVGEP